MNINFIRQRAMALPFMAAAFLYASLWSFQPAFAADLAISAAGSGTVVQNSNTDTTAAATLLPALGSSLQANGTSTVSAYYGVRTLSATTTGNVHWRITVHSATGALSSGMVSITEKGSFNATGHTLADSAYTPTVVSGDLVLDSAQSQTISNGDDFTTVDQISFSASAPAGAYTITRELIDDASSAALSGNYVLAVSLSAAADVTAPAAPVISSSTPLFASSSPVTVSGTAEASSTIEITGGVGTSTATTTALGEWNAMVNLIINALNHLTVTATDSSGNTSSSTALSISEDETAPVITAHGNVSVTTSGTSTTALYVSPLVTDNFSATSTASCAPVSGSVFSLGTTTINCNGSDQAGNTASSSFRIIVSFVSGTTTLDLVPPVFGTTTNITVDADSAIGARVDFTNPTATDNVSATTTVSCSPSSGSFFALGDTTVNCTATDQAGNIASTSFNVTVNAKTVPPIIIRSGGGGRVIPPGLLVAVNASNPNSAVAAVLAGRIEDDNQGQVLGISIFRFTRGLKIGLRGDDVAELQARLQALGLFRANITGYFGAKTAAALKAFQRGLDLRQTGQLDASTMTVLNES